MDPLVLTKREKHKLATQYAELCLTCGYVRRRVPGHRR